MKEPNMKEYTLCNFIYMKFRERKNQSVELNVRTADTSQEEEGTWRWQDFTSISKYSSICTLKVCAPFYIYAICHKKF